MVLAGILGTLALVIAVGSGEDNAAPTPSASASATPTPTPVGQTPSPTPLPPETAYQFVYREFGETEDVIWRALPEDPTQRVEMARIPHRAGFGIKPSLSPDGTKLAYLSLPEHALSAQSSEAQAFLLDFETQETVMLAEFLDLMFAPLWSPDGKQLYFRRLQGPEFLAAKISVVRVTAPPIGENTPTPTPVPPPSVTPVPTRPAEEKAFEDSIAHVLDFSPVGFSYDGESMFFVQIQGGTQQGSLLGAFRPATTEALELAWQDYLALLKSLEDATPTPTPSGTPAPSPSPFWETKLVVSMSEQTAFDYDLSGDRRKLAYLVQEFSDDGQIVNRAYWADIVAASVQPVQTAGLPEGIHLQPIWHPDSKRITVGIIPSDSSPGRLMLMRPSGADAENLTAGSFGFDEPRSWAPDGSWLAVSHSDGNSLTNPRNVSLDLIANSGGRVTVIDGPDNATQDSVLGWIAVTGEESGE
jgi:hypothetical protein